jgi:GNAT superfamily N-acetyltransferase
MNKIELYPLEKVPEIDGLVFRHFAGEADYPKMLAIYDNLHKAEQYHGGTTLESLRAEFTHLNNCDPFNDLIFAEVNGETIAFGQVSWERQVSTNLYVYMVNVQLDQAWQAKGIEQALIHWAEDRGRKIAPTLPEGEKGFFLTNCREKNLVRLQVLNDLGYTIDRYYHSMSRKLDDLPECPLPEGIEVRPVLPQDYRKIWSASNEAFMDEYGATAPTEEWYQSYLNGPYFLPYLWQVAWDGDEVVGSVQNFILPEENQKENRRRGYTEAISVRRPWRGRGVARALICRSMSMFKAMNLDEVALTADTQNLTGAMRLYTGLGYQPYLTVLEMKKPLQSEYLSGHQ